MNQNSVSPLVKSHAFLSYAEPDREVASALRDHLGFFRVQTWMYQYDKTLGADAWDDIHRKLAECRVALFLISTHTEDAQGQQRELGLFNRLRNDHTDLQAIPLFLTDDESHVPACPIELKSVNGIKVFLGQYGSVAWTIVRQCFPESLDATLTPWFFPRPGQWLTVAELASEMDEVAIRLGELVYFRRLSPAGFFECFVPSINGNFWFKASDLAMTEVHNARDFTAVSVPRRYSLDTIIQAENLGLRELERLGVLPPPEYR